MDDGGRRVWGYAAVIGDLAGSRRDADRAGLQGALRVGVEGVNRRVDAIHPLAVSVGDEFQGLFPTVAAALEATLLVRLELFGRTDVRFGIGWGGVATLAPERVPFGQDGSAWWAARDAIDAVRAAARRPEAPRHLRTLFRVAQADVPTTVEGLPPPRSLPLEVGPAIDAYLVCRDEIIGGMDARDARLLNESLAGKRQSDIAAAERVSQPAVSQRLSRNGGYALRYALDAFGGDPR